MVKVLKIQKSARRALTARGEMSRRIGLFDDAEVFCSDLREWQYKRIGGHPGNCNPAARIGQIRIGLQASWSRDIPTEVQVSAIASDIQPQPFEDAGGEITHGLGVSAAARVVNENASRQICRAIEKR